MKSKQKCSGIQSVQYFFLFLSQSKENSDKNVSHIIFSQNTNAKALIPIKQQVQHPRKASKSTLLKVYKSDWKKQMVQMDSLIIE